MKLSENTCKLATVFIGSLTPEILTRCEEAGINLPELFSLSDASLREKLGNASIQGLEYYMREEALNRAREEEEFMERHNIRGLFCLDEDYPSRLMEMTSPPKMLFMLGNCSLESAHNLSVVGTRRCTQGGMDFCRRFIQDLSPLFEDLCVVSGLAYGIDSVAHSAALETGRSTVAVLAHGLDTLYPAAHRNLAREIIARGGALLSEYPSGIKPFRGRFLERNRIVAGLSDAVAIIESEVKGGAMSTANTAFSFNREVFAMPGRPTDQMSAGCNRLIAQQKAHLLTNADDFIEEMGWKPSGLRLTGEMRCLFPELEGDAKRVYDFMRYKREACSPDTIHAAISMPVATVISVLGELEFDGIVVRLPGNKYELT